MLREYLGRVRLAKEEVERCREELERLRALAEYARVMVGGVSGGGGSDSRLERLVCAAEDCRRLLSAAMERYIAVASEVRGAIAQIGGRYERQILTQRYLLFKRWVEIARECGLSLRHVFRLHEIGLKKIKAVIECHIASEKKS